MVPNGIGEVRCNKFLEQIIEFLPNYSSKKEELSFEGGVERRTLVTIK